MLSWILIAYIQASRVMRYERLPIGEPIYFEGKYEPDDVYDLYIQRISCSFKIKPNKIPTIQIKHTRDYIENEYLTSSKTISTDGTFNEIVTLTLTNVDLDLFLEQYEVDELKYEDGWKFKSIRGLFDNYIDKWIQVKDEGTKEGNKAKRTRAKLMLNSLYGKFSTSPER